MKNSGQSYYIGKAGQLAVMSEIALRGYNVAIPEVDKGDDIFAVNDDTGIMHRLQVKTSLGHPQRNSSHRCQFEIRVDQITRDINPDTDYVFVARLNNSWEFVIIPRVIICHLMQSEGIGTKFLKKNVRKEYLKLGIVFYEDGKVLLGNKEVTRYKNKWDKWNHR
jgi:hypothetical protein